MNSYRVYSPMGFVDPSYYNWIADTAQLTEYTLQGDQLTLNFLQQPSSDTGSSFSLTGQVSPDLGFGSSSGMYLDMQIADLVGNTRTLRIYYEGYGPTTMGISTGTKFAPIELVSFDGVRQVIVYQKATQTGLYSEAVFYPVIPSSLYALGDMNAYSLPYDVSGYSQSFFIKDVTTLRSIESEMANKGSNVDVGRIGAEIAYTVATETLDLKNVVMIDPSRPGPDLFTKDGSVLIEARMLQRTALQSIIDQKIDIKIQLARMVGRMQTDLVRYPDAQVGYVIFTYLDNSRAIHIIVLEVHRA